MSTGTATAIALVFILLAASGALMWLRNMAKGAFESTKEVAIFGVLLAAVVAFERWAWLIYTSDLTDFSWSEFGSDVDTLPTVVPVAACAVTFVMLVLYAYDNFGNRERSHPIAVSTMMVTFLVNIAAVIGGFYISIWMPAVLRMLFIFLMIAVAIGVGFFILSGLTKSEAASTKRAANSHYRSDGSPKVGYADKAEAEAQAAKLHAKDGAKMAVYKCSERSCNMWHTGRSKH